MDGFKHLTSPYVLEHIFKELLNQPNLLGDALNITQFNLYDMLNERVIIYTTNSIKFIFDCNPGILVNGDKSKLKQVIHNLLSNAIKFTENKSGNNEKKIEFEVSQDKGSSSKFNFSIKDSGVGIDPKDHERILEHAHEAYHISKYYEFNGNNLGLRIVKQLLYLMGSRLKLKSELGKGSTFSFDINFKPKRLYNVKLNCINFCLTCKSLSKWLPMFRNVNDYNKISSSNLIVLGNICIDSEKCITNLNYANNITCIGYNTNINIGTMVIVENLIVISNNLTLNFFTPGIYKNIIFINNYESNTIINFTPSLEKTLKSTNISFHNLILNNLK